MAGKTGGHYALLSFFIDKEDPFVYFNGDSVDQGCKRKSFDDIYYREQ